ncbi:MAG: M24 family metallopeptidase [Deltaproteobacteria bacterium]|nr:M24 family metallopeptidase [Deltaproteobacteria bacterium]
MKRLAALVIVVFTHTALAQQPAPPPPAPGSGSAVKPKAPAPKKKPAPKPADPYAGAPDDPYAEKPAPPAPKPAKLDPKKKPAKGKPADPYAETPPEDPAKVGDPLPPPIAPTDPAPVPVKVDPNAKKKPAKPVDPYAAPESRPAGPPPIPTRVSITDTTAVQGLLAVQRLDAWLLFDRDQENPIAKRIVSPDGNPSRPWFYTIPARGEPIAIVHDSEKRSFEHLPGKKLTYTNYKELDKNLKLMLKGIRSVALEYSPRANVPSISRVDAGTLELIRSAGVQVRSSATLVQYTKAIWGDAGRTAHYVAAHHLVELRKDALAFVAKQLASSQPVSEYDVQQRLTKGMVTRGLAGTAPVVAAGVNTADPYYVPTAAKTQPIRRGDLIVISLAAKVDKVDGVYAAQTWVAVADSTVRDDYKKAFETAALSRDHALSLITDRVRKGRPLTGAEVDQATRAYIKKSGSTMAVMHRTGHSMDNDLQGGGADLDDLEVRDTRILTLGTGFTVGPGIYLAGQFGVRTEVSVYLSPGGPEITTPAQDNIEILLR